MSWRPLDDDVEPQPLKASLDSIARKLGAPKAEALAAVFDRWSDVVGDAVAAHTRPRTLKRGVLSVAVDHPSWATELRSLEPEILAGCARIAGDGVVTKIDVRVAPEWSV